MSKKFKRSHSSSPFSKAKKDFALGLKRSPLLSWRYGNKNVQQLLLVPRDLRTADPSLSIELDMGQFGLAGATVFLNGGSPLHASPPNIHWEKELHGFGWIRNLRAARTDRAQEQAQEITHDWLAEFSVQKGLAWDAEVAARRLISWLSHSNFLLFEADEKTYLRFMAAIDEHMKYLSITGMQAKPGLPRLLSLIALMFAGLCVNDQERFADQHEKLLCDELDNQILADGGHISRDNSVLASILIDLLPLKQCFVSRNLTPPQPLLDAISRMLPMINYMRLGDGLMSRFNGAGTTLPDTLSTAMAYDDVANEPLKEANSSRYFRLNKGNVILLMDGGTPAELELTENSHAGCLSFEMSSGSCPVIINCGAAPPAYHTMANNARATVSHSTLTVNNRSSAQFVHDTDVGQSASPSLLFGPPTVKTFYEQTNETSKIIGSHDGYLERFGLIHHRMLSLSNDGYSFTGEDWIEVIQDDEQDDPNPMGWPFAVHFHIHPDVIPTRASDGKSITLTLPDSQEWRLSAQGQIIYLEESTFYADFAGPCQSVQAVIRGNCIQNTKISWLMAKVVKTHSNKEPKVPEWMSENVIPLEQPEDASAEQKEEVFEEETTEKAPPPPPAKPAQTIITDLVEDTDEFDEDASDKKSEGSLMERLPDYTKDNQKTDDRDEKGSAGKTPPPPPIKKGLKEAEGKDQSSETPSSSMPLSERIASMRDENEKNRSSDDKQDKPLPVKKLPPKKTPMSKPAEDDKKPNSDERSKKTGPWTVKEDDTEPDKST